ncbi:MAG: IS4/IS5 family transposase, partial [Desulfuromusa sp.]|nr:IS4/IS5 family transposase [Desulfuromusa sp.]
MSYSPSQVKNLLFTIINEMTLKKDEFVERPGIDFSRRRKFPFEEMITTILTMGGGSIDSELLERFGFTRNTASASAFVQQRSKLKPDSFRHLFRRLVEELKDLKTFEGYRLLAFDGSDIHLSINPKDSTTYYETSGKRGYNLMHLNALYDLQNKIYLDANLKPGKKQGERAALIEMIDRSKIEEKVLLLCDRGL